eukprot:scaffold165868_cov18-Tisochrysis_lutea.AAC.2
MVKLCQAMQGIGESRRQSLSNNMGVGASTSLAANPLPTAHTALVFLENNETTVVKLCQAMQGIGGSRR